MRAHHVVVLMAALALTGCAAEPPTGQANPATATTTTATTAAPGTTAAPAAEPFALSTHCGISAAAFAGRDWVATTPQPRLTDVGDGAGLSVSDGYADGTMTVLGDDLIRFVVTDPTVAEVGLTVDFVPAAAPPTSWCE